MLKYIPGRHKAAQNVGSYVGFEQVLMHPGYTARYTWSLENVFL